MLFCMQGRHRSNSINFLGGSDRLFVRDIRCAQGGIKFSGRREPPPFSKSMRVFSRAVWQLVPWSFDIAKLCHAALCGCAPSSCLSNIVANFVHLSSPKVDRRHIASHWSWAD